MNPAAPLPLISEDPDLAEATTAHLVTAEKQIAIVRWVGLVLWALVLVYRDYRMSPLHAAWLVYAGGLVYALALQWQLARGFAVRTRAWSATVGDPLLAVIMCSVTGGLDSVFLPFCHFTLLAAAFRFGVPAALLVLGLNSSLLVVMGVTGSAALADTLLVVAYLCFSAVFGVMLAGWAGSSTPSSRGSSNSRGRGRRTPRCARPWRA